MTQDGHDLCGESVGTPGWAAPEALLGTNVSYYSTIAIQVALCRDTVYLMLSGVVYIRVTVYPYVSGIEATKLSDVFGFGIVCWELCTWRTPCILLNRQDVEQSDQLMTMLYGKKHSKVCRL